jgi:uncharacterized RDD family membrane protein YckC
MPREGRGSMGRFGRRLVGVVIDWALCLFIAVQFLHFPWGEPNRSLFESLKPVAVFAVENLLLVGTLGSTIGHRIVGLRVVSTDGRAARPLQVLVRTVLLCLFLPAMFWDKDGRGLHDKAAGTVIVRT